MSMMPCQNSSCRSYGTPHPNCKCYGGMAKGGMVKPFCSRDNKHDASCRYYKGGVIETALKRRCKK